MELPTAVKTVFLLLCAVHASVALTRGSWWLKKTPRSVCLEPGEIICSSDCTQVMVCLGDGEGGYNPSVVATCEANTRCSAVQSACVAEENSECHPPVEFTCHDMGSFPDPYDCQKYHVCTVVGAGSIDVTCPDTSAYNPLRADCSLTTSDRVCTEGPITPCSKLGEMGVVQENPAIYYICTLKDGEMIPEMYKCPGSEIFDTAVASCVEPPSKTSADVEAHAVVTPLPASQPRH